MVKGIEHIAIASADPARLAQWYVDHLDFVIHYRSSNSRTHFVKAADGSMIEIIEASGPAAETSDLREPGLRHLAILVSDFDSVHERLKGKGVSFLTEKQVSGGNSTVFFTDCDGNILHLLHREKAL
jgi:glyoxylase I family protein